MNAKTKEIPVYAQVVVLLLFVYAAFFYFPDGNNNNTQEDGFFTKLFKGLIFGEITGSVVGGSCDTNLDCDAGETCVFGICQRCVPQPSGTLRWWPGDGNDDELMKSQDLVLQGSTFYSQAIVGQGLTFDSNDDKAFVPHDVDLNPQPGKGFTVAFWMKGIKNQPESLFAVIDKSHHHSDQGGWVFQGESSTGRLGFLIHSGAGTDFVGASTGDVLDGNFHHITGTWDSTTGRVSMYVDGQIKETSSTTTFNPGNNNRNLNVGFWYAQTTAGARFFRGVVDEMQIFNRTLSAAEIQEIASSGSAGECKPTCGNNIIEGYELCDGTQISGKTCAGLGFDSGTLGCSSDCRKYSPASCTYQGPALPTNALSWWKAENNAEDTVNDNNGATSGSPIFAPGRFGQGFIFDSDDDRIRVPNSNSININSPGFTLAYWMKGIKNQPSPDNLFATIDKSHSGGSGYVFQGGRNDGRIGFSIGNGAYHVGVGSLPDALDGMFHHIAGIWDGSNVRLYFDGRLQGSAPISSIANNGGDLIFGGWYAGRPFRGNLDEVHLHNRVLTEDEILGLYSAQGPTRIITPPCTSPPSNMVSWWPGDGNVDDIRDSNQGTLVNGATFTTGKIGNAMRFDGVNDYVEVPDSANLKITSTVSIDFWVKRTRLGVDLVVEKGGDWTGGQTNYGTGVHNVNNNMFFFTFAGGWRGTSGVSDLGWHHYVVVAINGQANPKFYIDGVEHSVEYSGGAGVINLNPSTKPLHIGAQVDPSIANYYSANIIDELGIYNRGLTTTEIQAIYNAGAGGKCKLTISGPAGSTITTDPETGSTTLSDATGNPVAFFPSGTSGTITVSTNPTPSGGGMITVQGANLSAGSTKTLYVVDTQPGGNVCALDTPWAVSVSEKCTLPGEIEIPCTGEPFNGITCTQLSGFQKVSGLLHSAVGEILEVQLDTIVPSCIITSPTQGGTVETDSVTVTGTITDNLEPGNIRCDAVVGTLSGSGTTKNFLALNVPLLLPDVNTITCAAADTVGNTGICTVTVQRDATPPTITNTPVPSVTNIPSFTVTGTVIDNVAVANFTINGQLITLGSGGSYSTTITLVEGGNTIIEIAADTAGNTAQATKQILLDTQAPTTTATSVDSDGDGFVESITLTGVDAAGIKEIKYSVNQEPFVSVAGSTANVTLPPEIQTASIRFFAVDNAGNVGDEITKTYSVDACSGSSGQIRGCSVGDRNTVILHVICQGRDKTPCGQTGSKREPLGNAKVKVFDINKLNGVALPTLSGGSCTGATTTLSKNPSGNLYDDIYECAAESTLAGAGCTTEADGICMAGEDNVGDYLVIVKSTDIGAGKTGYTGQLKFPSDFVNNIANKKFQFIQVYKKDGTIQFMGGQNTVITGSRLDVVSPLEAIWEEGISSYLYPFIFDSETDWTIDLCAQVPAGYSIVGAYDENGDLVTTNSCYQTLVAGRTKVIAFDVAKVGSPHQWEFGVDLKVKHNNKETKVKLKIPTKVKKKN